MSEPGTVDATSEALATVTRALTEPDATPREREVARAAGRLVAAMTAALAEDELAQAALLESQRALMNEMVRLRSELKRSLALESQTKELLRQALETAKTLKNQLLEARTLLGEIGVAGKDRRPS